MFCVVEIGKGLTHELANLLQAYFILKIHLLYMNEKVLKDEVLNVIYLFLIHIHNDFRCLNIRIRMKENIDCYIHIHMRGMQSHNNSDYNYIHNFDFDSHIQ